MCPHHLVWVRVPWHGEAHWANTLRQPVTLHHTLSSREQRALCNLTTVLQYCAVLYCTVLHLDDDAAEGGAEEGHHVAAGWRAAAQHQPHVAADLNTGLVGFWPSNDARMTV